MGTIHCNSCLSVNFTLCADFTRYVSDTLEMECTQSVTKHAEEGNKCKNNI